MYMQVFMYEVHLQLDLVIIMLSLDNLVQET